MLISPVKYAVVTLSMRRQSPNVYIPFAKVALWNILRRRKRARPAKMLSTSRIHCNTSASTEQCKTSSTSWCRIYREMRCAGKGSFTRREICPVQKICHKITMWMTMIKRMKRMLNQIIIVRTSKLTFALNALPTTLSISSDASYGAVHKQRLHIWKNSLRKKCLMEQKSIEKLIFCAMMNSSVRIIRSNLSTWHDGDFGIRHYDFSIDPK